MDYLSEVVAVVAIQTFSAFSIVVCYLAHRKAFVFSSLRFEQVFVLTV
jgi:hypothetical protein